MMANSARDWNNELLYSRWKSIKILDGFFSLPFVVCWWFCVAHYSWYHHISMDRREDDANVSHTTVNVSHNSLYFRYQIALNNTFKAVSIINRTVSIHIISFMYEENWRKSRLESKQKKKLWKYFCKRKIEKAKLLFRYKPLNDVSYELKRTYLNGIEKYYNTLVVAAYCNS